MNTDRRQLRSMILDQNRKAWDNLVRQRQQFTTPAPDDDLRSPLNTVDAAGWLGGDIAGRRVLCLAAGGGRQSALYAAAGAMVTVLDLSPEMLALDRQVAAERKLNIEAIEGSMDDLSMLPPESFDVVIHPVSTCYLPQVMPVFLEVARVTTPGGIYISQHKSPTSLQASLKPSPAGYCLQMPYYMNGALPPAEPSSLRERGTTEFLHRWEEILGGMCRAGFWIDDLYEPALGSPDAEAGSFAHRANFVAPYVRVKAIRKEDQRQRPNSVPTVGRIWTP